MQHRKSEERRRKKSRAGSPGPRYIFLEGKYSGMLAGPPHHSKIAASRTTLELTLCGARVVDEGDCDD